MPKIVSAKRLETETDRARAYVKAHILFPAGLLGLASMVVAVVSLAYQLIGGSYSMDTFFHSSGMLIVGGIFGWAQTRYHRFLVREYPWHFASRMKTMLQRRQKAKRTRREQSDPEPDHSGRSLVPYLYLAGFGGLLGLGALGASAGTVDYLAAFVLPWAGFFWAKMFFWRRELRIEQTQARK